MIKTSTAWLELLGRARLVRASKKMKSINSTFYSSRRTFSNKTTCWEKINNRQIRSKH